MARKPANLVYGLDDRPPWSVTLLLAFQHAVLILMFVAYPLIVAAGAGFSPEATRNFVTATILAMGIGTILQAWSRFGSGYLLVHNPNPIHIPTLIQAGAVGGPALIATLGLFSAAVQASMGRIIRPLRRLLPAEVCGVTVTMLGVSLILPGLDRALELSPDRTVFQADSLLVAALSLAFMLAVAIFARGRVRLFSLPIGIAVGWAAAAAVGLDDHAPKVEIAALPWLDLPLRLPSFAFDFTFVPAIVLGAFIAAIDTLGIMISVQRMNDADWRRADLRGAARGMVADGASCTVSSVLGGMPTHISSSNVGLAFATGATARIVATVTGAILVVAALCPRVAATATMVPLPVLGAIILYSAAYLITSGMELILSRRLSERRVFMVGLSIIAGISLLVIPQVFRGVPEILAPFFGSPLSLAAIVALLLNLVFQIGISRQATLAMPADANPFLAVQDFLDRQGELWGARRDVIVSAARTTALAAEAILESGLARDGVRLDVLFDETHLDVAVVYQGTAIERPNAQPAPEALLGDEREVGRYVGWTLGQLSDSLELRSDGDRQTVLIRFEH
ncbi:uracil-xanthine permease family protein [Stella sp.]|uniref:uracil-xanthine permease family protein n=1 Tax=Stella sp. TaxID=2912054 RepID=UPI0035B0E927